MLDVDAILARLAPPAPRRCACCRQEAPLRLCLSCADAVAGLMRALDMTDDGAIALLRAILADPAARSAWAARAYGRSATGASPKGRH